eukprot:TRINITY_DN6068_c0_g1_i1.p2 TRINITY_DN6068_c0_g1~~TRINITY_DN6068_c0_g1_i1.p2  ORF type:complete len:111 (-),score=11.90 TRINITY_DN6068_c0_g1_i1:333-617(-)
MHEVVCTEATQRAVRDNQRNKRRPPWRVSSTVFSHISPDVMLQPITGDAGGHGDEYMPTLARDYIAQELQTIKLAHTSQIWSAKRLASRKQFAI